jgi:hypothetical protein
MPTGAVKGTRMLIEFADFGKLECHRGYHMPVVTQRFSLLRWKHQFWVRCWECDLKAGPFKSNADANYVVRNLKNIVEGYFSN